MSLQSILSAAETAAASATGAARYDFLNIAALAREELAKGRRNIGGSILPSSSPQVLEPQPFRHGALVVRALPDADTHGLFWNREEMSSLLATHSNGHSCHNLGKRMIAGNVERVRDQAEYILRCGGTCIAVDNVCELLAMPVA